jgi:hypothetical protein
MKTARTMNIVTGSACILNELNAKERIITDMNRSFTSFLENIKVLPSQTI